jgi:hypothetical protein
MNTIRNQPVLDFSPTEQWVICELAHRAMSSLDLIAGYTGPKQSIYKALRSLYKKGVIIDTTIIELSKLWIYTITTLLSRGTYAIEPMWHLQNGEKLIYYFDDFSSCDNYFFQLYMTLPDHIPLSESFVFHNPHQWFFVTKYETEKLFWNQQFLSGRNSYISTAGSTVIDKHIGYDLLSRTPFIHFSLSQTNLEKHNYYTSIGDWIVIARADDSFNRDIDNWFQKNKNITPENQLELAVITNRKCRIKMTILRDSKKASELRKKIMRDFM